QAFGLDLPVLQSSLADAIRASGKLNSAFGVTLSGTTISNLQASPGFTIEVRNTDAFTNPGFTPTEGQELLRIRYRVDSANESPAPMLIGGDVGLFTTYTANGGVQGSLKGYYSGAASRILSDIVFGVDVRGGQPTFYVSDGSKLTVSNLSVTAPSVTGTFARL